MKKAVVLDSIVDSLHEHTTPGKGMVVDVPISPPSASQPVSESPTTQSTSTPGKSTDFSSVKPDVVCAIKHTTKNTAAYVSANIHDVIFTTIVDSGA